MSNKTMENDSVSFNLPISIKMKEISTLLCCAFEGGFIDWIVSSKINIGDHQMDDFGEGGKFNNAKHYFNPSQIIPTIPGCSIVIKVEDDDNEYALDLEAINKGLMIMAKDHFNHFADFVLENYDAITGDVFLQLCLFGKLIYA